jgi:hypothetical protein
MEHSLLTSLVIITKLSVLKKKLAPLRRAIECLVVSMAEFERSFSAMNDIAFCDTRSSPGTKRISAPMFAKLLGPKDIPAFNSESYVRK